jgi:hypothetical protein
MVVCRSVDDGTRSWTMYRQEESSFQYLMLCWIELVSDWMNRNIHLKGVSCEKD